MHCRRRPIFSQCKIDYDCILNMLESGLLRVAVDFEDGSSSGSSTIIIVVRCQSMTLVASPSAHTRSTAFHLRTPSAPLTTFLLSRHRRASPCASSRASRFFTCRHECPCASKHLLVGFVARSRFVRQGAQVPCPIARCRLVHQPNSGTLIQTALRVGC